MAVDLLFRRDGLETWIGMGPVRMRRKVCASGVGEVKNAGVPKQRQIALGTRGFRRRKKYEGKFPPLDEILEDTLLTSTGLKSRDCVHSLRNSVGVKAAKVQLLDGHVFRHARLKAVKGDHLILGKRPS